MELLLFVLIMTLVGASALRWGTNSTSTIADGHHGDQMS